MPRTKKVTTHTASKEATKAENHIIDVLIKNVDMEAEKMVMVLLTKKKKVVQNISKLVNDFKMSLPKEILNKTVRELEATHCSVYKMLCSDYAELTMSIENSSVCSRNQSSTVRAAGTMKTRSSVRRSRSTADDDGYLTAESSSASGTSRISRSRSKGINKTKQSRSLSRSKLPTFNNKFKTPLSNIKPQVFQTITPKIKPNTPSVLLRKPAYGETVISMQGSPLMVSTSVEGNHANINIPLPDGRVIALQPQRGLRVSRIPSLDLDTQHELETLRDNLNKVCEFVNRR